MPFAFLSVHCLEWWYMKIFYFSTVNVVALIIYYFIAEASVSEKEGGKKWFCARCLVASFSGRISWTDSLTFHPTINSSPSARHFCKLNFKYKSNRNAHLCGFESNFQCVRAAAGVYLAFYTWHWQSKWMNVRVSTRNFSCRHFYFAFFANAFLANLQRFSFLHLNRQSCL